MKVAILGAGPSYRLAPLGDPAWEVWGCNSLWRMGRRDDVFLASRWFELHPRAVNTDEEVEAVLRCPVPIYVLDPAEWPAAPHIRRFPLEAVLEIGDYYTCTFAYQIALAIYEDASSIGLYGVSLEHGSVRERVVERACVEWWLGYAEGRGVEVVLPADSGLARAPYRYGYDYDAEGKAVRDAMHALDDVMTERGPD